jgi:chitinase
MANKVNVSAVWALTLLCASLFASGNGHAFMALPKARHVLHKGGSYGMGDIQSLSGGGTALESKYGHGLCGDTAKRREFMAPNAYGPAKFGAVATYQQGQAIDIEVDVTAHHWGWFEFRLCVPKDGGKDRNQPITQDCLNKHVLKFDRKYTENSYAGKMKAGLQSPADFIGNPNDYVWEHSKCKWHKSPKGSCCNGGGKCSPDEANEHRWVLPDPTKASTKYKMRYLLPPGVHCERCVLQFYYQTGNSPDNYPEGFWNCADIAIEPSKGGGVEPTRKPTQGAVTGSPTKSVPAPNPTSPPASLLCRSKKSKKQCQKSQVCKWAGKKKGCVSSGSKPGPSPPPTPPQGPEARCLAAKNKRKCNKLGKGCFWKKGSGCRFKNRPPTRPTPKPSGKPTPKPTPPGPVEKRCYSIDPRATDKWCEEVKCDPQYKEFCSTTQPGKPSAKPTSSKPQQPTSKPTSKKPTAVATKPPTKPPFQTPSPNPSGKINIIGFYGNSGNALGHIPLLPEIPCYYNVIILTFVNFASNGEIKFEIQGPYAGNMARLKADVKAWRAVKDPYGRRKQVLFSIGGQNGHWPESLTEQQTFDSVMSFLDDYDLDGMDVDLEGAAVESASTLVNVIRKLRNKKYTVVASPEAAQGPLTAYADILPLLDYWHPQFYNNGPNAVTIPFTPKLTGAWSSPPKTWQGATPSGYQGQGKPWWVSVLKTTSDLYKLKPGQRGMLIPATTNAAGNNNNWNIALLKDQVQANGITHVGTWAIAYDKSQGWKFAKAMAQIMHSKDLCV